MSVIYSENAARLKWDLIGWMVLIPGLLPPDHWTVCLCVSGAPENKTGSDRYEREGRPGKEEGEARRRRGRREGGRVGMTAVRKDSLSSKRVREAEGREGHCLRRWAW